MNTTIRSNYLNRILIPNYLSQSVVFCCFLHVFWEPSVKQQPYLSSISSRQSTVMLYPALQCSTEHQREVQYTACNRVQYSTVQCHGPMSQTPPGAPHCAVAAWGEQLGGWETTTGRMDWGDNNWQRGGRQQLGGWTGETEKLALALGGTDQNEKTNYLLGSLYETVLPPSLIAKQFLQSNKLVLRHIEPVKYVLVITQRSVHTESKTQDASQDWNVD